MSAAGSGDHSGVSVEALELFVQVLSQAEEVKTADVFYGRLCDAVCQLAHMRRALIFRYDGARRQVRAIVEDRVQRRLEQVTSGADWEARFALIAAREQDPYSVAEEVLREVAHDGQ